MLNDINDKKLKEMTLPQLTNLCEELRKSIIQTVMENGGHLSSNLGMVELTVALHYVFDLPEDKVIFDVGHQCYTHKILSGRAQSFNTLRKRNGISGFPKREESQYDCYNTGHAGTSISAALGIAKARDIKGENFNVIAVIGDGSFNNGLVYEAFNSLRPLNTNILVILNDNGMSISPTVGSMHEYLESLSASSKFTDKKANHANIFKRFGFSYDGVYDGNDLACMIDKLAEIKEKLKTQSVILHILTKKGKGYAFCEENPQSTHGISSNSSFDYNNKYYLDKTTQGEKIEYSTVLGDKLCQIAQENNKIIAVTAAMTPSLGLSEFFKKYPERSIDVGICEEHATILCAALATQGLKPYYAVYSTFLQRSIDEIIIDICSQNLPVTICVDRAGVSGADGETHQGVFDLSFLNFIPNLTIAVPKDIDEFEQMIDFSSTYDKPFAIRYPRDGKRHGGGIKTPLVVGKWEKLIEGNSQFAILACGERMIEKGIEICNYYKDKNILISLINARFVKPLDQAMLSSLKEKYIITLEDNMLIGGFGSLVDSFYSQSDKIIKNFAYSDEFIPHGNANKLIEEFGVSTQDIISYINDNAN